MPRSQWAGRAFRTSAAGGEAVTDPTVPGATILDRFKVEDVVGKTADTKFTSWVNAVPTATPAYDLNVANNGGLTYRAAPAGFGTCAAAEVAAGTDGLYASFGHTGGAVPFSMVAFGRLTAAGANGDFALGSVSGGVKHSVLSKVTGFWCAQGQGGNGVFYTSVDTSVMVYTVVFNTAGTSKLIKNVTVDKSDGNTGGHTFAGALAIGKGDGAETGAASLWNEFIFYSGDVSSHVNDIIVPYFRTKSGLALL